jgi:hypothetical protein
VNLVALGRIHLGEVMNVETRLGRLSRQLWPSFVLSTPYRRHAQSHLAELLSKDLHILSRQVLPTEESNTTFGN